MRFECLKRFSPPGMELKSELACFFTGMGCSTLYSMLFLTRYARERRALFDPYGTGSLIDGAVMPDFHLLLGLQSTEENILIGFAISAVIMLSFIIFRYMYYRQGSKSIYLMKRLPARFEIHKRALVLPITAAFCFAAAAFFVILLYFAIYMLATPNACIQPGQWGRLWGGLL